MAIKSLDSAKKNKNDELYTRFDDISEEILGHKDYQNHFKGKVIYCNCDDPAESAFADFFKLNFEYLGLKKLICTRYAHSKLLWDFYSKDPVKREGYKLEITGRNNCVKTEINGNGDFRSKESIELLKEADIVCTNPPFSLFREYVTQLIEHKKKFLIIGPLNAITYKEFFPFIADNKVWGGYGHPKNFLMPNGNIKKLGNVQWWTNLPISKRTEQIELVDKYSVEKYPKFDNYDVINVNNVKHIPCDYYEAMAVPITFLDKYNPNQFEILDAFNRYALVDYFKKNRDIQERHSHSCNINGKSTYFRILIRRRTK